MNTKSARSVRKKGSYRLLIRKAIERRLVQGEVCSVREIIKEVGGGSATTVLDELAKADKPSPGALIGRSAQSPYERIAALEAAVNASIAREAVLASENAVLRQSLQAARADVDKLLVGHQDSQRLLLQGVDDLRQMVKAGKGGLPTGVVQRVSADEAEVKESADGILWKAKHDQLLTRFVALESKSRRMASQLHDLGVDVD